MAKSDNIPTETDKDALAEKEKVYNATKTWWAACKNGHAAMWAGPDRDSYKKARADGKAHDDANHDGKRNFIIFSK